MPSKTSRLGRPPASSSAETRGRIIDIARRSFADQGYDATTNRAVAGQAGVTTAAIYHYFDSKLDIYKAVFDEVQDRVYRVLESAEQGADTFVDKIDAVFQSAHELNRADSSLAQFLGSSRIDRRRHPEVAEALSGSDNRSEGFFEAIVERGIETGELRKADRGAIVSFIRAFSVGLTDGPSSDHAEHRRALDGFLLVLRGYVNSA